MATRRRWVMRTGELVEVDLDAPRPAPVSPMIMKDTQDYLSPVTNQLVSGRYQRREDLARTGCREVDPSESGTIGQMKNPEFDKVLDKIIEVKHD